MYLYVCLTCMKFFIQTFQCWFTCILFIANIMWTYVHVYVIELLKQIFNLVPINYMFLKD